jgi:SAM-dependent methyltransferase
MDNICRDNRERWNALANANVMHSVPFLDFTREDAADYVYGYGILEDVSGKRVLCLANGGGQASVAFGLLDADVTVLDLSDVQLERDREAARHHGLTVETVQGDMRDLSMFGTSCFDVVWQPYSLNYSPTVEPVFREVARVLKPNGIYEVTFANPFAQAMDEDSWDGEGYRLRGLYTDGEDVSRYSPTWEVEQPDGSVIAVDRPHEFRHNLSTLLNALVHNEFVLLHLKEWMRQAEPLEPGSWSHFTQAAPPWVDSFWRLGKKGHSDLAAGQRGR